MELARDPLFGAVLRAEDNELVLPRSGLRLLGGCSPFSPPEILLARESSLACLRKPLMADSNILDGFLEKESADLSSRDTGMVGTGASSSNPLLGDRDADDLLRFVDERVEFPNMLFVLLVAAFSRSVCAEYEVDLVLDAASRSVPVLSSRLTLESI